MSQEVEIEFKNLLTKQEYDRLIDFFHLDKEKGTLQENHYFDTKDFLLKKQHCALRIRHKNGHFELTLKEPLVEGLLETTDILVENDAVKMIQEGGIIEGQVKQQLLKRKIPTEKLLYFGTLSTVRLEKEYKGGMLILDYSYYLNQEDFEIEYEVSDTKKGYETFINLLEILNIPKRKTKNKVQRFYEIKYKSND